MPDEDGARAGTLKRPDLEESAMPKSRYIREFSEISEVGMGSFSKVGHRHFVSLPFYSYKSLSQILSTKRRLPGDESSEAY